MFECPNPPGNVSKEGLGRFCRRHLEHYRRHGDPLKASYTATQLHPHRTKAAAWIKASAEDRFVLLTLRKLEGVMAGAGPAVEVRNLRGLSTSERANATWARLRERETSPEKLLAVILGAMLCHEADPQKGKREFRQVQIAKVLSRIAGGQVKRWPTHNTDTALPKERVMRWFAPSEGLVLRELGEIAERAVEFLAPDRLGEIARYGADHD